MQPHCCSRSGNESTKGVGKVADAAGLINGYGCRIEYFGGVDGVGVSDRATRCEALVTLKWRGRGATGFDL